MAAIKTAFVAASLVAIAATANAQSREDLNSGYHGNTVWSSPYSPTDEIEASARDAYGSAVRSPWRNGGPLHQPRVRQGGATR